MAGDLFTPDNEIADKEADIMVLFIFYCLLDYTYGC